MYMGAAHGEEAFEMSGGDLPVVLVTTIGE